MAGLTLDAWLAEYTPVRVALQGKPAFAVQVDLAALTFTLYEATQEALKAAEKSEAGRLGAVVPALARVIVAWDFTTPPDAAGLTRLGERVALTLWDAITDFLLPAAPNASGSASG